MQEQSQFLLELRAYLVDHWKQFGLPGSPAAIAYRIRPAPRGRAVEHSRMVALWFTENPEEPLLATKWVSDLNFSSFIVQEHRHARWLYEIGKHHFIPEPLACPEIAGTPVLIERAVRGRSFAHQMIGLEHGDAQTRREAFQGFFARASEILGRIQDPLKNVGSEPVFAEFEPYFSRASKVLDWDANRLALVESALREFPGDPVPGSGETLLVGDFAPQNLLSGPEGIYLIDLEFSRKSVLAFLDPLSFVNSVFRFCVYPPADQDGGRTPPMFREQLLERRGFPGEMAVEFLESRGLPRAHHPWYWLLFFIHETAFQHFLNETFLPAYRDWFNGLVSMILATSWG